MSQYRITCLTPAHTCIVGWDNPLQSFFAQVYEVAKEDTDSPPMLWVGAGEKINSVNDLQIAISEYAQISPQIQRLLVADFERRTPPSPLQRLADKFMQGG